MANLHVNLAFSADTGKAKAQIQELQTLLSKIAYTNPASSGLTGVLEKDIKAASAAAKELQFHLNNAFNTTTGKFDLSLLDRSLKISGSNITDLSTKLLNIGPSGQQAFMKLAQSISLADQPMFRISNRMKEFAVTMKNTIKWQLSSSMLHGFMGAIQSAYGYAQDLNKSLTDIRIVTGYNTDQMAAFAEQANKAAKALNTTTTDYTNASLIYFQQGLDDASVQERTDVTVKMANAAGQSAEIVSDQLTAVWNNFYDGSKSLEYYADVMTALGAATATSTDEIAQGLSKFAAVADTVGLSYEFATAALATITSNTRESADVVGNALKTLFARIQGLQLGETLDDGTDLNKYSQALDKVGISIYDYNGELKAMDDILTEMAAKWETLNSTQQVALAQTVAGVRQYTQLIALMENWDSGDGDSFVANLNTIDDAEGTLQEQADIYAQSWEAASKKVKAAAEGIYQSLLDDEFFINFNNSLAEVLTGIDSFIDNAGGVKTVLIGIGSTILSVFSHQIPKALDTLKYNLSILTKGSSAAYQTIQSQMQAASDKAFADYEKTTGQKGISRDSSMGYAIQSANELTAARNKLAMVSDKMSEADRQAANITLGLIQAHQEEIVALKQKNEAMKESIQLSLDSMSSINREGANDYNIDRGIRASTALKKHEGNDYHIGLMPEDIEGLSGVAMNLGQTINEQIVTKLQDAKVATNGLSDNFNQTINIIKNSNGQLTEFGTLMQSVGDRLTELSDGTKYDISASHFNKIKEQAQEFISILPSGVSQLTEIKKALANINSSKNITELTANWQQLQRILSDIKIDAKNVGKALEGTADGNSVAALSNNMRTLYTNTQKVAEQTTFVQRLYNDFNPKATIRMSEAMGSLTGLAGNAVTVLRTLQSTFTTLSSADTTGLEKFSAVLTAIAFGAPAVISALTNVVRIKTFLSQEYAKAAAAVTADTIATTVNTQVQNLNNAAQLAKLKVNGHQVTTYAQLNTAEIENTIIQFANKEITEEVAKAKIAELIAAQGVVKGSETEAATKIFNTFVNKNLTKSIWAQVAAQLGLNAAMLPYIAILAAIGIGIGVWISHARKEAEAAREGAKAAREAAAAKKEEVEANEKLVNSYIKVLNNYNSVKKAFANGEATAEDLTQAQDSLAESAYEVATALGVEGAALAQLSGDYENLTTDILAAQKIIIQEARNKEAMAAEATKEEFIADMRDDRGFILGDKYNVSFDEGWDTRDEAFFGDYDKGKLKHWWVNSDGIGTIGVDATFEEMMAAYEEALILYDDAMRGMTAEERNKSELFQALEKYINKTKDTYKAYQIALKNIEKYDIQLEALNTYGDINSAMDISSIEEYEKYSSGMIDALAQSKGIEKGTEEWNQLADAVHTYLSSLDGVEEFATKSKAFDEIAEKTGMSKKALLDFYNSLSDEDKELFFKINFDRADTTAEFKSELEYLKNLASLESIKVSIDLVKSGEDLVGDGDTTIQEWTEWAQQISSALKAIGIDFDIGEFLSLTEEEQLARLAQYESMLEQQESLERESAIRMGELRIQELSAYRDQNAQMYEGDLRRLQVAQQIQEAREKGLSKTEVDFDYSGYDHLWENSDLEGYINSTKDRIEAYEATVGDLNEAVETVADLKIEKDIEEALGWREDLQEEAELVDIDYDEIKDYAKYLRNTIDELEGNVEASESLALANKKLNKGIQDLADNWSDWSKALKKQKEDPEAYAEAMEGIRDSLENVFEVEVSDEFITENLTNIQKLAQGDLSVLDELQKAMAADYIAKIDVEGDAEAQAKLQAILTQIQAMDLENIEIGTSIEDAPFYDALNQMLTSGQLTADEVNAILSTIGYDPDIEMVTLPFNQADYTQASNGYTYEYTDPITGKSQTIHVTNDQYNQATSGTVVQVPRINAAKTVYKGSSGGGGVSKPKPSNSGGGGGGGKTPKHAEKKNDSDKERYHTIKNQLEDLESNYDKMSDARDRAFGADKLALYDDEIDALDDLIAKQEEYIKAIETDLPVDKAVMDAYYKDLIGGTIKYDEFGNIANYDQIQDAMFAKYNQMADTYDEESEEWQVFEDKYEQLEKYIEQYEETYDLLRSEEEALQDLINERMDAELAKIQYAIELKVDLAEDGLSVLEYQLSRIEDDAFKAAEAVGLFAEKAELLYDQMAADREGLNDILGQQLSSAEIKMFYEGDMSVLEGKTFTDAQVQAIKEYRDSLLELSEEFDEIRENIEEQVMEVFDAWNEKLETGIESLEHYGSVLESYKNIIDIVGEDGLGISDEFIKNLNEAQIGNAIDKVNATRDAYEAMMSAQQEAEEALEDAKARGDEASIKMWTENLAELTDETDSAQEEFLSAWEDALDMIAEQFEMTVERIIESFNESIYALGGLEGLSEEFTRQQETADIIMDDYQKIYELSKLSRDVQKTLDDTKIISGKQKLKKLMGEINDLQAEGVEMSQYDLEYLQAEYELRLAEIELEEARNAKDTVRLSKDNEGNWSYVYTQNSDAVDEAQQKYEDALYSMQDISSNYIDEMSEKLIETSQEMADALAALRIEDFASIDDYYAEVERIQKQYQDEMALQEAELQKAVANNKILYDEDMRNYEIATGGKYRLAQDFATAFKDTLLGNLMDSESNTVNYTDLISEATTALTSNLLQAAETYYINLENAMNAADTTTEDFATDTAENIDKIVEASKTGAEAVDQMAKEMTEAFGAIADSVSSWQETYGMAMQEIVNSNMDVIESFNKMLETLSLGDKKITVSYDIVENQDTPAEAFDTGGYTGEWGRGGRVAVVHQKELILNEDDTSNFLSAIELTRMMLETIDLNARQASLGLGGLIASTIKEDNTQMLEQQVHITAEFPGITDRYEVENALTNLVNRAAQYANRK